MTVLCLSVFIGEDEADEPDKVSRAAEAEIPDPDVFKFRSFSEYDSVATRAEHGPFTTATTD